MIKNINDKDMDIDLVYYYKIFISLKLNSIILKSLTLNLK